METSKHTNTKYVATYYSWHCKETTDYNSALAPSEQVGREMGLKGKGADN